MDFEKLVNKENLWRAWRVFSRGKLRQRAVCRFWLNAEQDIRQLYHEILEDRYSHGLYIHFAVCDTKRRDIYVASVRDRIVHQLLAFYFEALFVSRFHSHSYAAQKGKGVSAARDHVLALIHCLQHKGEVWIGKMDVEKYFASVNHKILLHLLARRIKDEKILHLCKIVIKSFGDGGRGLPLGNLTSQWFANIYLHELDFYAAHTLGIRYYMRYNDDIMVISNNGQETERWVETLVGFAAERLQLQIPKSKISIVKLPHPIDILGLRTDGCRRWIRPATARRAKQKLAEKYTALAPELLDSMSSYYGLGLRIDFSFDILSSN